MVIIPSPVAVSVEVPRGDAFWVVSDNGAYATGMNSHGGITITQTEPGVIDANPERIQVGRMLDKSKSTVKPLTPGSKLRDIIGLVNFSFGNWRIYPIETVSITSVNTANNATRYPQSVKASSCDLVIANYNVENLHVSNPEKKFLRLADNFVNNLYSPDIVGLQEIQGDKADSSGDRTLVSSSDTMKKLIRYIKSAGKTKQRVNDIA